MPPRGQEGRTRTRLETPAVETASGASEKDASKNVSRDIAVFEERLLAFPDPSLFTGKRISVTPDEKNPDKPGELTDVKELTDQLAFYAAQLEKKDSPQFKESGDFMRPVELQRAFIDLLRSKSYSPTTIHNVIRHQTSPLLDTIQSHARNVFDTKDRLANLGYSSPFDVLAGSESNFSVERTVMEQYKSEEETKRNQQTAVMVELMKSILLHPEKYGLIKEEEYKDVKAELTVKELEDRLQNNPFAEVFTVNGKRMSPEAKKTLCRRALDAFVNRKGANRGEAKKAIDLLYKHCIQPTVDEAYQYIKDTQLKDEIRQKELDKVDANTAALLNSFLFQDGLKLYGQLIFEGTLPEDVSIEDLPVDFPYLREREPMKLKMQLENMEGEERFLWRLHYHLERIANLPEEEFLDKIKLLKEGNKTLATEVFSTEAGRMSQFRRLALIKVIFQKELENFNESDFYDFHAAVTNDLFTNESRILYENSKLSRKSEDYDIKKRANERLVDKLLETLYDKVSKILDGNTRDIELLEISGESGGRLLLTFQQGTSDDSE